MLPCRRFADVLADACARLGADVGRYSFIAVDFHHLLLAGLPAHSLALRPAHSRRHLYVTCYTEGFSHFVTSMTAPVASGWSVRRVGLAPTGKRRLITAHTSSRHCELAAEVAFGRLTFTSASLRPGRGDRPGLCPCCRLEFGPKDGRVEEVAYDPGLKPLQGRAVGEENKDGVAYRGSGAVKDAANACGDVTRRLKRIAG